MTETTGPGTIMDANKTVTFLIKYCTLHLSKHRSLLEIKKKEWRKLIRKKRKIFFCVSNQRAISCIDEFVVQCIYDFEKKMLYFKVGFSWLGNYFLS